MPTSKNPTAINNPFVTLSDNSRPCRSSCTSSLHDHHKIKCFNRKRFEAERAAIEHFLEGIKHVNQMAFSDTNCNCRLALQFDESANAPNDRPLDRHSKHLLKQFGDSNCYDVVDIIRESLAQTNPALGAFKLRLVVEEQEQEAIA